MSSLNSRTTRAFSHADPTTATPVGRGQDFYVPRFEVKLQGRPVGRDVVRDILQVSYKDSVDDIDSFEIQINNWDADARDYKYADDSLFDPGKILELYLGYHGAGDPLPMVKGEITSLRPSFPADGTPKLAISGLNILHRFRTKQESHTYINKKDSDIAVEIGSRLGITVKINDEARRTEHENEYLIQNNQFDIVFLMERARRDGYDLLVRENAGEDPTLYFGPSQGVRRLTYLLVYGRSLVEFQPTLTTANQVNEVTVRGWDAVNKTLIEATADRSMIKNRGVGAKGGQDSIDKSFSQRKEVMADKPFESTDEAKRVALDTLENIAKDMVKGTGSCVGLPGLRAGTAVEIGGLGTRYSGRYFVTATTHTCGDGGYTTQFECRREENEATTG